MSGGWLHRTHLITRSKVAPEKWSIKLPRIYKKAMAGLMKSYSSFGEVFGECPDVLPRIKGQRVPNIIYSRG